MSPGRLPLDCLCLLVSHVFIHLSIKYLLSKDVGPAAVRDAEGSPLHTRLEDSRPGGVPAPFLFVFAAQVQRPVDST